MFLTVINDSRDDNSMARQASRLSALIDSAVHQIGVSSDLEAAGNLIDVLDAGLGMFGAALVNIAPRNGDKSKRENGSPFIYFFYKDTLVVSTVDGLPLSLVKKFKIVDNVELLDIEEVLDKVGNKHGINEHTQARMRYSQFRSLEFLPYLTKWLLGGESVPSVTLPISRIPDAPMAVWWIDSFGNCKTTITPGEINFEAGKKFQTKLGEIKAYQTLRDVPNGEPGIVIGSSGFESARLIEIVVQGGNAAQHFNLEVGAQIF